MTTFIGGPAKGQHLMLKRKVRFLRVVQHKITGAWDALDMPEDKPLFAENIYVYEAVGEGGMCHIYRGGSGGSGFYSIQEYKFVEDQPDETTLREPDKWVAWVDARAERLGIK